MRSNKLRQLQQAIDAATTYSEWRTAAIEYDELAGNNAWKEDPSSTLYDYGLIKGRWAYLTNLLRRKDDRRLLYALNEGIHGNLGGMGRPALYQHAKFGTKKLITDYIYTLVDSLNYIAASNSGLISFAEKLDFFRRASLCFGHSALMLSGGVTQGIFHLGVAKALFEENLLPRVISGASTGSLVAALLSTHSDAELEKLFTQQALRLETLKFNDWKNIFKGSPLVDPANIESTLHHYVPDLSFDEAFAISRRKLNICITPEKLHQESRMLNAISSPRVHIRKGVMASCAVPGLFPPVVLTTKSVEGESIPYNPNRLWVDGSLSDDMSTKRLARLHGVNLFIVSQANLHALPYQKEKGMRQGSLNIIGELNASITKHFVNYLLHRKQERLRSPALGIFLTQLHALASQDPSADVIISPPSKFINLKKYFSYPDSDKSDKTAEQKLDNKTSQQLLLEGQRATWPKIEMIRNYTLIGQTLDIIIDELEKEEYSRLLA